MLQELVDARGKAWKSIGDEVGRMPSACRDRLVCLRRTVTAGPVFAAQTVLKVSSNVHAIWAAPTSPPPSDVPANLVAPPPPLLDSSAQWPVGCRSNIRTA